MLQKKKKTNERKDRANEWIWFHFAMTIDCVAFTFAVRYDEETTIQKSIPNFFCPILSCLNCGINCWEYTSCCCHCCCSSRLFELFICRMLRVVVYLLFERSTVQAAVPSNPIAMTRHWYIKWIFYFCFVHNFHFLFSVGLMGLWRLGTVWVRTVKQRPLKMRWAENGPE